jgi:hypothetical protein
MISSHEAPTPKADAADQVYDDTRHHYGFGGLNLLRPFGMVAFLAGLIGENLGSRSLRRRKHLSLFI